MLWRERCFRLTLSALVILAGVAYFLVSTLYEWTFLEPELTEDEQGTILVKFMGYVPQIIIEYVVDITMKGTFAILLYCCIIWYYVGRSRLDQMREKYTMNSSSMWLLAVLATFQALTLIWTLVNFCFIMGKDFGNVTLNNFATIAICDQLLGFGIYTSFVWASNDMINHFYNTITKEDDI